MPRYYRGRGRPAYPRKRYGARRAASGGSWGNAMTVAKTALRTATFLKGVINAEKKFFDVSLNAQTIANTGIVSSLDGMSQGSGGSQRNGNGIKAVELDIRGTININGSATVTFVRAIVVIDKDGPEGGSAPTWSAVMAQNNPTCQRNMDTRDRFVVLYDQLHNLDVNGDQTRAFHIHKALNHHIRWDTTGGTAVTTFEGGHLYLMLISDQASLTPVLNMTSRLRFYDN